MRRMLIRMVSRFRLRLRGSGEVPERRVACFGLLGRGCGKGALLVPAYLGELRYVDKRNEAVLRLRSL